MKIFSNSGSVAYFVFLFFLACTTPPESQQDPQLAPWLTKQIDASHLRDVVNTYHMMDSSDTKVGSMVFGLRQEGNRWLARDTSQFDDGSVYETVQIEVDLEQGALSNLDMDIQIQGADVFIDLAPQTGAISGAYKVLRDTTVLVDREIDSAYVYDIFREEVYMLLHTIDINPGDSLPFKMFFPNSFTTIDAAIVYEQEERIEVPAGTFDTTVIYLNTGGLLDNRIWIAKGPEKKLVKFFVPSPYLNIELVESRTI